MLDDIAQGSYRHKHKLQGVLQTIVICLISMSCYSTPVYQMLLLLDVVYIYYLYKHSLRRFVVVYIQLDSNVLWNTVWHENIGRSYIRLLFAFFPKIDANNEIW